MMHNTAQGLASLGRGNDSMLMHVTPNEVAGLQGLAMAHGGSLTINPQTGLPEAGIFDAIGSVLPVAASMMFPTFAPGFIAPGVAAGALAGAAIAGLSGKDPLMGGLTGGFGGYSGAQLAKGFTAAGTPVAATEAAKNTAASTVGGAAEQGMFKSFPNLGATGGTSFGNTTGNIGMANTFGTTADSSKMLGDTLGLKANDVQVINSGGGYDVAANAPKSFSQNMSDIGSGIKNTLGFGDIPQADAWKAATSAAPNMGVNLALTGATTGLAALEPSGKPVKSEEDKYDPYASLNLSGDTGLRLYAAGGDVNTNQSSIASGGLQSLYGTSDNSGSRQPLSQDGYGIGRLGSLAAEGSRAKAADTFYAQGGPVSFDKGGETSLNLATHPSLNLATHPSLNLATHPSLNLNLVNKPSDDDFGMMDVDSPLYRYLGLSVPSTHTAQGIHRGLLGGMGLGVGSGRSVSSEPTSYALNLNSGQQEAQYAQGGYLDGAGDGMSDSIPATIEGKQPARLADGEFVVPADVVSHIGNGSSKAGSKRLYAMLDKVRHARTGNKKQGKEIKADKYLPA